MKILNLRYKIDRQLHKDSSGTFYAARDMIQQDKLVCLKIFNSEYSKTEFVQGLINRFMHLKSVKHPNLAEIYEFDRLTTIDHKLSNKIRYFYTSEYLDDFQKLDYTTLSVEDTKSIFVELMRVMSYLHFRGIVYQYLNFINVNIYSVNNKICIKLIDLVAVGLFKDVNTISDHRTSLFIPPEVIWSQQFDYSSDIYALGHLLYYLHYRYDYEKYSLSDIFDKEGHNDNEINKLIRKMISNYVEDRNYDIHHLVEDYCQINRMVIPFDDQVYYNRIYFGTKLIGREKDFDEVYQSIIDKFEKKIHLNGAIISGETGIGKTRFLREISYILNMHGFDNINIELTSEHQKDFSLFTFILKNIFRRVDVPQDLIHKYGSELTKIIPEISNRYKINSAEVLEGDRELLKLSNRIFNFLLEYSTYYPLLLVIDNIDLANRYDLIILDYLHRSQKDVPIYIVSSINKNTLDDNPSVDLWEDSNRVKYYQLNKFNYDDANQLIKLIMGINNKPINFTTRVMKDAEGNPRLIEQIIQNLYLNKKIYVQQHKNWYIADIDNLDQLDFTRDTQNAIAINLDIFTDIQREILNIASVFIEAVVYDILERLLGTSEQLMDNLKGLIDVNILSEKFGDFGYTYNFNDRHLAEAILRTLSNEQRKSYHERISMLLEDDFNTKQHFVTESLIYHLKLSDQVDKAVNYCFLAAERMREINIYSQAVSFYKRAIDLRLQKSQEEMLPEILLKIASIYLMLGQQHEAELNFEQVLKISKVHNKTTEYIDALNGLTHIAIIKSELSRAYNYYNEAHRVAIEQGYVEGELQAAVMQCKIFMHTNDFESIKVVAESHLEISRGIHNKKYEGMFLNQIGIAAIYAENNLEKGLENFNASYVMLSEIGDHLESVKALNNLGVILIDDQGDIIGARSNFEKIVEYYDMYNIVFEKAITLNNIGETYFNENRYAEALELFNTAYKIAEETNDISMSFAVLVNVCRNYIDTGDYDKAYLLLKKLEADYQNDKNRGLDALFYYIVHVHFYMKTKNLESAEKWMLQYRASDLKIPDSVEILMEIFGFRLRYNKENYLNSEKVIDLVWLRNLEGRVKSGYAIKLLREFILEICIDLIHSRKFILVQELIAIERTFFKFYDSRFLSAQRKILDTAYEANRENRYEVILDESKDCLTDEQIWNLYKVLGDEYFTKNNFFKAISNYMMAMDIIHKLSTKIPNHYRDAYIMNDETKLDLKYRINELKRRIVGTKNSDKGYAYSDYEVSSCDEFFNLADITDLYKNQKFLRTVQQIYFEKYETRFEHINDLIRCLQSDELYNIKQMLLYFVQYCFADRGYVIVLDENGNQQELIKSAPNLPEPNVKSLMRNMSSDEDGIIISFIEQNTNSQLLGKNLKGIICIPVTKMQGIDLSEAEKERRKLNNQQLVKDRLGYIYLETDNIFNNFSRESYKHIKTLMNLLFVMMDNYNLKKISSIDKLTGVFLRKHFEDLMNIEVSRAKNNNLKFSLVMCDIDKFKSVNDTFGHRKGDEILRKIGHILSVELRLTDLVGRYGGEEFIVLLPVTTNEEAFIVCEKIRVEIESQNLLGLEFPLTMSFGISTFPDNGLGEEELLEKADQALYYSKNNGRNRTTLWNPNIGNEGVRFDKLTGILSGNISKDTRNVQAIVNMLIGVRDQSEPLERSLIFLNNLMDITEATQGFIFIFDDQNLKKWYGRDKSSQRWLDQLNFDAHTINEFCQKEQGEYYINWNDIGDVELDSGEPKWKSFIFVPQKMDGGEKAVILLTVAIADKEFDFADFNFVSSMSGLLTTIL